MAFNHEEASEKLVEFEYFKQPYIFDRYITQDIGTMATLAIENSIDVAFSNDGAFVTTWIHKSYGFLLEFYADHNNDKVEATCIAIYKALVSKKEG